MVEKVVAQGSLAMGIDPVKCIYPAEYRSVEMLVILLTLQVGLHWPLHPNCIGSTMVVVERLPRPVKRYQEYTERTVNLLCIRKYLTCK